MGVACSFGQNNERSGPLAKDGVTVKGIPLGALGVYTFAQKFRTGFQQLMAGSRNFRVSTLSRRDLMALTRDAEEVSGIPWVMKARYDEALNILLD